LNKEGQDNHQNEQNDTGFIPHSKQKNQFQILYELKCERQNSKAYEKSPTAAQNYDCFLLFLKKVLLKP